MSDKSMYEKVATAYNAAISFTLELETLEDDSTALIFLNMWNEGDWSGIKKEFPEFDLSTAPINHEEFLDDNVYNKEFNVLLYLNKVKAESIDSVGAAFDLQKPYKISVAHFEKLAYIVSQKIAVSSLSESDIFNLEVTSGDYLSNAREIILWRSKNNGSRVQWGSYDDYCILEFRDLLDLK